jgi:glycosyltransferase involved in cell wall biosynthesis
MAAGKPIVFSVFAEHNNLVDEAGCGLSASPDSASDLAEKLVAVARMPAEDRRAMGQRGRDYVRQHHDYSLLARRLANMIEELDGSGS